MTDETPGSPSRSTSPEEEHPLTREMVREQLAELGVCEGDVLMLHSSLSSLGCVLGGPDTVIRGFHEAVGPSGTVVMPAFSPAISDPAGWPDPPATPADLAAARTQVPAFDLDVTPTSMGAIPEAFRTWPGVLRSSHPQVSVCARGPRAEEIVTPHALAWGQGRGSPFERLYGMDARLLLLGVGFNRATLLHYAESRVPHGRRKTRRIPSGDGQARRWIQVPDVGDDLDTHFPEIGRVMRQEGLGSFGRVGAAECALVSARTLVDRAETFLSEALSLTDR